ncbi:MAG TPA: NADH-ubiquinone oxidoreductase-F iron-sulfur binding region domain-containing protein [Nocardioides sp.]|uniref:NADH-ubiquinone oxidoreductase-F iron-sulfur binding region domain-containing protein n=1 Tax=Nocardioides sp. TaxID=35761 RepID=UPI002E32042B|nr:NADH-ubiquinone oxidoreductase-F iron-sulfur binding region domain-containing protein [Nocardioides sp.]HEX5087104.1 NADH-ubiquinone oxidoreductase-F iron-sulfur binding region domain-containing protein [Nocardioides sp.]
MTATIGDAEAAVPTAWGTARLLAGTRAGRLDLARHRDVHDVPRRSERGSLADALDAVGLLGRGGAAFPVATKLLGTRAGSGTYVVVNGSEGEPASHKDRALMRLAPHLVLDGALAVARSLRTRKVDLVVQDRAAHASLAAAVRERRDARGVRLVHHDHGFVGGEVRAVTRALSGGPALPPGRRVLPTVHGVDGRPTFASNVETFAQIALLLSLGVDEYAGVGAADEPGTTLLTLLGDVPHPGVVEVPTGLPLSALVGERPGPVLVGGYHGTWLADPGELTVSRPTLRSAGAPLNAGVLARLPHDTCALGEVATVAHWLADQSVGQCGPCFFGLPALAITLDQLAVGRVATEAARQRARLLVGRGACAHPDGAAAFVASALTVLDREIAVHRRHGHCGRPLLGVLPTGGGPVTR